MNNKLFITVAIAFFLLTTVTAQVFTVPKHAKTDFAQRFKNASDVKWTNNVSYCIAKFKENGEAATAYYHLDGYWDYTERMIDSSKVPSTVKESFSKSKYRDWSVKSLVYVENNKDINLYRYEVKKGIEKKYVFFDKDGKLIKENISI